MAHTGSFSTDDCAALVRPSLVAATHVDFHPPYVATPRVVVALSSGHVSGDYQVRIRAQAHDHISRYGVDLHLATWANSTMRRASLNYLVLAPYQLEFQHGEFSTLQVRAWQQTEIREHALRIEFERAYASPPRVLMFLTLFDAEKGKNWRVDAWASDVDARGFTAHLNAWDDTLLHSATASWIAYPEDRPHTFSGYFTSRDGGLRPRVCVDFEGGVFEKAPLVFAGFKRLDIDGSGDLKFGLEVDQVSKGGMHLNIELDRSMIGLDLAYVCVG